ncbi:MAG: sulfite exporter TauE/SafE family protein [Thermomicrobiales bacterium]
MIGTISPLVQEARSQWWQSSALHSLGSVAGGVITLGALGGLGYFLMRGIDQTARWAAFGLITLLLALGELDVLRWPLVRTARSVPKSWWQDWGPRRGAFTYGFVLGLGVTTVIPFGTYYAMAAGALLVGDILYAVGVGVAYGLGRALPVLVVGAALVYPHHAATPRVVTTQITEKILGSRRTAHLVNGLVGASFAGATAITVAVSLWS